jgi:hypothetical protein
MIPQVTAEEKKTRYSLNRITLRFADCTDKISRIYPVASSLIVAMLFADFCSIHVLLPTAPTNSNKRKSSCRLTSYMVRCTKAKFLVLLRELKVGTNENRSACRRWLLIGI